MTDISAPPTPAGPRSTTETMVSVRYWTNNLLSFVITRPQGYRFTPGHYARVGLDDGHGNMIWRPLSVVSAADEDQLEFFVILIPGGAFSERLALAKIGDPVGCEAASFGFMTIEDFAPGKDLWLMASGTGLGPYLSIMRDPATWKAFETLVVVHSVRQASELAYKEEIAQIALDRATAELPGAVRYVPVVTREVAEGALSERIPQLIESGKLEDAAGISFDLNTSRIMVCGNPEMARELRALFTARGFKPNRRKTPGQLAFENYWQNKPVREGTRAV